MGNHVHRAGKYRSELLPSPFPAPHCPTRCQGGGNQSTDTSPRDPGPCPSDDLFCTVKQEMSCPPQGASRPHTEGLLSQNSGDQTRRRTHFLRVRDQHFFALEDTTSRRRALVSATARWGYGRPHTTYWSSKGNWWAWPHRKGRRSGYLTWSIEITKGHEDKRRQPRQPLVRRRTRS